MTQSRFSGNTFFLQFPRIDTHPSATQIYYPTSNSLNRAFAGKNTPFFGHSTKYFMGNLITTDLNLGH